MRLEAKTWIAALLLAGGCASAYTWRSSVPQEKRTVSVPSFISDADSMEAGAIAARQVAREFQREGTFRLAPSEEAALEIQGNVKWVSTDQTGYSRRQNSRFYSYSLTMHAEISVIDKRSGKVLVNNREYEAYTTTAMSQDATTAERDAMGRLADDLARQIVDDVLNLKW